MGKKPEIVQFAVTGPGAFPVDMLRYDGCWPATEADSHLIDASVANVSNKAVIQLRGFNRPTTARWKSFLWNVVASE